MKVKVKDIARVAGVSPTTVSLVLNNKPSRIADDTKEHIFRVAREMQFQMASEVDFSEYRKVKTLGMIVPDKKNPFYDRLAEEVADCAFLRGYTLFQCGTGDDIQSFYLAIESLMSKNVDGIIVIPPRTMDKENVKLLKSVQKSRVPLMLLDRAAYGVFCDFVTADNKHGGRIATEYLIRQGHTKIGCMVGDANVYTSRKRVEGYREALAAAKIPFEKNCVYYGHFDVESGYAGAKELLDQGVTAIVAGNDLMAYGLYRFAGEHGYSVPGDLSVIGYDNTELCELMVPPLTSIDQNAGTMASKAVEVILQQVEIQEEEEQEPARNYYFTPYIQERESVRMVSWS
ncbi:LacI family transcriptional regulator [Lachnospiraceae bacterium ASD4241]|uniref:LacI family transcriptional regulator n=1 Tax=Diplocloster modestus TaxID=2850322 RepID=A0ABS6K928_9FIRM|nr:LacI family DNA-binding transcriptional regulator [Diplocloster modestus]MBU9727028.1 LacI family transcriptional regulator [Diplocloster modestus]